MKRGVKTAIVFIITIVVIIAVFWFIIPTFTNIPESIGGNYFIFSLVGSFVLSMVVSGMLNKLLFKRG
jgi:hypothetical protein